MPYIELDSRAMRGALSSTSTLTELPGVGAIISAYGFFLNNSLGVDAYPVGTDPADRPPLASMGNASTGGSGNWSIGHICVMKGTMPANVNTITSYASMSADVLVSFPAKIGRNGTYLFDAPVNAGTLTNTWVDVGTKYTNASATGTATWLWIFGRQITAFSTSAFTYGDAVYNSVIGSVGLAGTGSDFEMANINIITGQPYRVNNMKLTLPSVYNY